MLNADNPWNRFNANIKSKYKVTVCLLATRKTNTIVDNGFTKAVVNCRELCFVSMFPISVKGFRSPILNYM